MAELLPGPKTLPKAKLADVQEQSNPDIDSCTEAYGDWPQIDTPCDKSPVGQCEYSARDPERCMWCGEKT